MSERSSLYKRHRFSSEIIQYVVWLYHRRVVGLVRRSRIRFRTVGPCAQIAKRRPELRSYVGGHFGAEEPIFDVCQ